MMRLSIRTTGAVILCATTLSLANTSQQEPTDRVGLLSPEIPDADPQFYQQIEENWLNPFVSTSGTVTTVIFGERTAGNPKTDRSERLDANVT
jgi:hypothetical protein